MDNFYSFTNLTCVYFGIVTLINTNHHSSEVVVVGTSYPVLLTFHHNYFQKLQTWSQHDVNLGWSLSSLMRVNRFNSLFDGSFSPNISRMDKQRPFLLLGQIPLWVMLKTMINTMFFWLKSVIVVGAKRAPNARLLQDAVDHKEKWLDPGRKAYADGWFAGVLMVLRIII